jgi:hypothetical protein
MTFKFPADPEVQSNLVGARILREKVRARAQGSSPRDLEGHASSHLPSQHCSWGQSSGRTALATSASRRRGETPRGWPGWDSGGMLAPGSWLSEATRPLWVTSLTYVQDLAKGLPHLPCPLSRQEEHVWPGVASLSLSPWSSGFHQIP